MASEECPFPCQSASHSSVSWWRVGPGHIEDLVALTLRKFRVAHRVKPSAWLKVLSDGMAVPGSDDG